MTGPRATPPGSLFTALRPKRAGDLRYLAFGKDRQWFYVEWGDGVMVLLASKVGLRWKFRVWRIR